MLDYLVVQGHKNAAEQFCREMQTSPDGHALTPDFHAIQSRTDVRNLIQRGQIEQAIERINDLNPQVSRPSQIMARAGKRERDGQRLQTFHAPLSDQCSLRAVEDDLNHARCVLYEPISPDSPLHTPH